MSRPPLQSGKKPHPKMLFRPRCERLEERAMMAVGITLNGLYLSENVFKEGGNLVVTEVDVSGDISNAKFIYSFDDGTNQFPYIVPGPPGTNPNVNIPWSEFQTGLITNGMSIVYVTLSAFDATTNALLASDESGLVILENAPPAVDSLLVTQESGSACGASLTVSLDAQLTDFSSQDLLTAEIIWDYQSAGQSADESIIANAAGSLDLIGVQHTYAEPGTYTVRVTPVDSDGEAGTPVDYTVFVTGGGATGDVDFADGVLTITGSCGDDLVYVSTDGVSLSVQANFLPAPGHLATFTAGEVTEIRALLGDGDDAFTVGGNIDVPMVVVGGDGNDVLMGGRAASLLIGGDGADMLFGGRGEDALIGGSTLHDENAAALGELLAAWLANLNTPQLFADEIDELIVGDEYSDVLHGGQDVDLLFLDGNLDDALASRRDVIVVL